MTCIYTGAFVSLPDYGIHAPADLYKVGDAIIVRFNGDPTKNVHAFEKPWRDVTHIVHVNRYHDTYNRLDTGTIVIQSDAVDTTEFAKGG